MLSTTSQYALRALTHLARQPQGSSMLGRNLAKQAQIPGKYLSKIMTVLRNAGLIAANRGTGGGYSLSRPADAIHLIDVVELFEGDAARPECLLAHNKRCSEKNACSAHKAWRDVRNYYLRFLEKTTLTDISEEPVHATQLTRSYRTTLEA